ncbi:CBL-interacting serine/threonine-protein kinase 21 isoform X2 [Oryza brachyantha]|uniref:CBL-interacting serine/threonine-protein kinase 21 isoform X2 n=1 Tax=Oryza brachyantha TaxID=4533 RepID=UPI001ADACD42|nr:CBL-interacting serine/threonine-protein kinase 21 isoform X2 [Oryza brachyantha]
MGFVESIGRYRVGRTIGAGTFAKVRLAVDGDTGATVAVKVIDKRMVLRNNLMYQVKREITAMKLLNHPNIVKIYEVIATKTKICLVMEYISGGQLSGKLSYLNRLDEMEAKKYFYQLIDAVDYCHRRDVYHRDLKPENLLLDNKGDLKVSDFGLSVLRKPGQFLSTSCGSPCYVAPEVVQHKSYDGAAADVWSCGVILFELLAGHLPFQDCNLTNLYRRISRAQFAFPQWLTVPQKKIIIRILDPSPITRAKISDIFDNKWLQDHCNPSVGIESDDDCVVIEEAGIDSDSRHNTEVREPEEPDRFINAFQLIATCSELDLSGLFQEQETLDKIKVAAKDVSMAVRRMNSSVVELQDSKLLARSNLDLTVSAEVIKVTPAHCVVEVSKSTGDLRSYKEFCRSLSSLLNGEQHSASTSDMELD